MFPGKRFLQNMILTVLAVVCAGGLNAQPGVSPAQSPFVVEGLGRGTVALDGLWQFHLGDDLAWAKPEFDDATGHDGWEQISADEPWGMQGHFAHTGFAWYRRRVEISSATDAPLNLALLVSDVGDIYEVYWNGKRVGGLGTFPPYFDGPGNVAAQVYALGPAREGTLAIRVFAVPLASGDDGTGGGLSSAPRIGSAETIALLGDAREYRWLRSQQFRFGLTGIYLLVSLISLVGWLRSRRQGLMLWVAVYAMMPLFELCINVLRLPISLFWVTFFSQVVISVREVSQWFLLAYLLQLVDSAKLMRFLRIAAGVILIGGVLDGALFLLLRWMSVRLFTVLDAVLAAIIFSFEILPAVLVLMALVRGGRLGVARGLVAFFAFFAAAWYSVSNIAIQGVRMTHWTLGDRMNEPLFTIFGNSFRVILIARILLFLSIVNAVLRYVLEQSRRQKALEQEFQNARELQQVLIPESLPEIAGYALTSAYKPASEVGGDFFQIIPLSDGETLIVLGDVSGKGLKAAMAVSLIVGMVRALARLMPEPGELLAEVNDRLVGRLQGGFATAIALRVNADGQCVLASAGHLSPFVNGYEVEVPGAFPLGLVSGVEYETVRLELGQPGRLALFTDGLLEARNDVGELYGFDRMTELFATKATAAEAMDAAVAFGQDDDITVLTLERRVFS
jgi:hypothetical protein